MQSNEIELKSRDRSKKNVQRTCISKSKPESETSINIFQSRNSVLEVGLTFLKLLFL